MSDLCQLSDVKTQLGITDTSQDILLRRLITAASDDFMTEIKRTDFAPAVDYVEWIRHIHQVRHVPSHLGSYGFYSPYRNRAVTVFLEHYPVNTIAKVTLDGTEIAALANPFLAGPGYWFDPEREDEERQSVVLIDCVSDWFTFGALNQLEVDYNAGYDEIPPKVNQAVIEWVGFRLGLSQIQQLDQAGGSVTIGTYTATGDNIAMQLSATTADIPMNVARAIEFYRRMVI